MVWPFSNKKKAADDEKVVKAVAEHQDATRRLNEALAHARGEQINEMMEALVPRQRKERPHE